MVKHVFIPFFAAMVALTLLVFWRTSHITSNLIEREHWKQMDRIAGLLVKHPYLLNPTIHSQLEELLGVKIGYYDQKGNPHNQPPLFIDLDSSAAQWPRISEKTMNTITNEKTPLLLTPTNKMSDTMMLFSRINGSKDRNFVLGLMVPTGPQKELRKNLFLTLAANAGLSLLLILVLTYSFSKILTRRIQNLLTTMAEVAEGKLHEYVPEKGPPEVRRLATAFNFMVKNLQQYQQRLRTSERLAAVGELSAVLAHEVRNPLTSLKMLGQVLKTRHVNDPKTVKLIDPMLSEIDRIERLVQSILDWSRPSSPQMQQVDLNALIADVLALLVPVFSKAGIDMVWQPGELPTIFADQSQLKQVLWNLLKNAENVSGRGDKIRLKTSKVNDTLQLIIEDQGPGLVNSQNEKLYEPFYTTRTQGLGLGLAISKRIIERHRGSLQLENSEQGGARALVSLPINESKPPLAEEEISASNKE